MDPSSKSVMNGFLGERTKNLFSRFPGWYRAIVIDTNDPLRVGRIRYKLPEMHNFDIPDNKCPWAVPAFSLGGKGSGTWTSPCRGDVVWITFEKNHPYGPIWTAAADPTMRRMYPLPAVAGKTPKPAALPGEKDVEPPQDYSEQYHPKDGRPMSHGIHDRYGHTDIFSAVGFFPIEHSQKPTEVGIDGVSKKEFEVSQEIPLENDPDVKYIARITKYGTYTIHSDVGYKWKSEFSGDFDTDSEFEINRWKYFLDLLNEGASSGKDQRRYEVRTRYGHLFEMRDVGWNKSRTGEYSDKQIDLAEGDVDQRWIKIKSKGGHLFQMIDVGSDPSQNKSIKKLLKSDVGASDGEDDLGRDQRMIRVETAYGFRQVMDDRGSDSIDPTNETPRGSGWYVSGRRDGLGYFVGFNEQDLANNFTITTPKGKTFTLDDRFGYVGISTDLPSSILEPWKKNSVQWPQERWLGKDPENTTDHLKMDKYNGYIRFKTRNKQGVEFRDRNPPSGQCTKSWAEIRDIDDRGLWFNADDKYAIWRNASQKSWIAMDENTDIVIIRNETGKIQIVANGDVDIKSTAAINLQANKISMKADTEIVFEAGGNQAGLNSAMFGTSKRLVCRSMFGTHEAIPIPQHPAGPAPAGSYGSSTTIVTPHNIEKKKPDDEGPPCNEYPTSAEAEEAKKIWEDNTKKREEIAAEKEKIAADAEIKALEAEKAYQDALNGQS